MLGKVSPVAGEKRRQIVGDEVDLSAHFAPLTRPETRQTEIGVKAPGNALEELLVWFPGRRKDQLLINAKRPDQSIVGRQGAERTRIDIRPRNPRSRSSPRCRSLRMGPTATKAASITPKTT